ncbi:MAG: type III toxin-antitoxin system ToxN/AbiQ family toxin [Alcaligenaceae bacterium]|nr:type III toxin-antitoxin system ToxN/AbiQ family toxin [Alcaligenaceae bacterium]
MKFYYINTEYVNFLKTHDHRVQNNYEQSTHKKPYIGIVLTINHYDYFAPLTSFKEKYLKFSNKLPTLHKVCDPDNPSLFLAVVALNNMIPVSKTYLTEVDFSQLDDIQYKYLLIKELKSIKKSKHQIQRKAKFLYNEISFKQTKRQKLCCNFKKLEQALNQFQSIK